MRFRIAALAIAVTCACAKPPQRPQGTTRAAPALFEHVPANTPYMIGAFEAVPIEFYSKVKGIVGPAFFRLVRLATSADPSSDFTRIVAGVLAELGGQITAKSLERLGLSASPRFVLYGHDLLPVVLRVEVKDDAAVLATIERVARRAELGVPARETRHGRQFWRRTTAGNSFVLALVDDQLVLASGPTADIDRGLPMILGVEKPRASMAGGQELADLSTRYRLGPHLIGLVDSRRVAHAFARRRGGELGPACTRALDRMAARVPRLLFGWNVEDHALTGAAIVELARDLTAEVAALQTELPGHDLVVSDRALVSMGMSLDVERGRTLALGAVEVLRRIAGSCGSSDDESSEGIDEKLRGFAELLASPLPEPWRGITGVVLALDHIVMSPDGGLPPELDLLVVAGARDPQALYAGLEQVGLPAIPRDGKLHPLAGLPLPYPLHAGVGARTVALASGPRSQAIAAQVLGARATGRAPLFVVNYDYAGFGRLERAIDALGENNEAETAVPPEVQQQLDEALGQLYGRSRGEMSVTEAGLELTWSIELE